MNEDTKYLLKLAYLKGAADAQDALYATGQVKEAAGWWKNLTKRTTPESINMLRKVIGEEPIVNSISSTAKKVPDVLKSLTQRTAPDSINMMREAIGETPIVNPITDLLANKLPAYAKAHKRDLALAGLGGLGGASLGYGLASESNLDQILKEMPELEPYFSNDTSKLVDEDVPDELYDKYMSAIDQDKYTNNVALGLGAGAGLGALTGVGAKRLFEKLTHR